VGSIDALTHELPDIEFVAGQRESRLLRRDSSLDAGATGKKLLGFPGVNSCPTRLVNDGDCIGSLQAITSHGHTPATWPIWMSGMVH
jgi:hypothetical protein